MPQPEHQICQGFHKWGLELEQQDDELLQVNPQAGKKKNILRDNRKYFMRQHLFSSN